MENGNVRHTDVLLGLKCPHCGGGLSLMPGRTQITFQCKAAHSFPMRQLFQIHSQDLDRGLRRVVGIWEEKAAVLQRSADIARREGRTELAQNFQRELDHLELRKNVVQGHLDEASQDSASGTLAG